jgi:hypothetical protein
MAVRTEMELDIDAYNAILPDCKPRVAPSASRPGGAFPYRHDCLACRFARGEGRWLGSSLLGTRVRGGWPQVVHR